MTVVDTGSGPDPVREAAIDAALAQLDCYLGDLPPNARDAVAAAFTAADRVYRDAEAVEVDRLMAATGFLGMNITGEGVQMRVKHAADVARAMVDSFDAFLATAGAENYTETECTVTDPAREAAFRDRVPTDQLPEHRVYRVIIVRPGRPSPHELRKQAEALIAAAVRLCLPGRLLDPRLVATALGVPPQCDCPGGPAGWETDFDPDCPLHGTPEVDPEEVRVLLPAARETLHWARGAWHELYADDPDRTEHDGDLVNVLFSVLRKMREPGSRYQPTGT